MIQRILIIIFLGVGTAGAGLAQEGRTHTVAPGETLYGIARTNGMSVAELKRLNGLSGDVIRPGQVLRLAMDDVPAADVSVESVDSPEAVNRTTDEEFEALEEGVPGRDDEAPGRGQEAPGRGQEAPGRDQEAPGRDQEAPGRDVGEAYDAEWPHSGENEENEEETTEAEEAAILAARGVSTHVAEEGETLYSIAADHGTKAYVLFTLNEGLRAALEPGMPVTVPASIGPATYEVRRGDTLSEIARRYGTTIAELRRANALVSDALKVGQTLRIPGAAAGDVPMQGGTQTFAVGSATVFPETYAGRVMASGTAYDPDAFVVAHRELPFDTILLVENAETGRASFARVADRGPVDRRHLMEISPALASEIGVESGGRVRVRLVE